MIAVDEILTLLQVQAGPTPSNAIIQSWTLDSDAATDCTEKEMDEKVGELFSTSNCKNIAFIFVAMRNWDVKRTHSCLCQYMYLHQTIESEAPQFHPVFMSELILDTNSLTYKPSEENFWVWLVFTLYSLLFLIRKYPSTLCFYFLQETVADFIKHFENMVTSVKDLTKDPIFNSVIEPQRGEVSDVFQSISTYFQPASYLYLKLSDFLIWLKYYGYVEF